MSVDAVIIRVSTSSILYVWAHDALCQAGEFVELGGVELILVAVLTVIPILTPSRAQIESYAGTSSALTVLSKKVRKEKKMTHVWQGRGFKLRTYSAASFLLPLVFFFGVISVHSSSISLSFPPTREGFVSRGKGAEVFFLPLIGANPEARSDLLLN